MEGKTFMENNIKTSIITEKSNSKILKRLKIILLLTETLISTPEVSWK